MPSIIIVIARILSLAHLSPGRILFYLSDRLLQIYTGNEYLFNYNLVNFLKRYKKLNNEKKNLKFKAKSLKVVKYGIEYHYHCVPEGIIAYFWSEELYSIFFFLIPEQTLINLGDELQVDMNRLEESTGKYLKHYIECFADNYAVIWSKHYKKVTYKLHGISTNASSILDRKADKDILVITEFTINHQNNNGSVYLIQPYLPIHLSNEKNKIPGVKSK
ncbi:MAG: hypothetical protein A2381_18720 [Bdellovibrionales bacterium RIFOXYB1_FULL_37_110]|nr:MAG: hypothetical protein A2417_18270 [Bdellovibrionales bacterium RIFOXYC1_FULL_37_79]OFZ58321.1 MAG: hypothetical protein A2381_18720 [Bdellovibrionales bacterium RIFOXYB1_FULL_37_110]OFZ63810.1 MAG: hypothetical protein A2577_12750 [Bdellovibrionales bacterium RIFOXYD1_FULL_36_51]